MADRYEIKGRLGRGGIGAVYRAFDTVMGREVAIKRLLPIEQTHLNEAQDESLQREAAALARLNHPNILTIFAFEEDEEGPYVVTELIDGETLKEAVERERLSLDDFSAVVEQSLEPLMSAHAAGLLHRDIKPANIMLQRLSTGRFQVKILDFGLAKFSQQPSLQTLDLTGAFLGSIDYIAPEQIDLRPLDFRTDLYSLGCVLYYALTQKPPFEGENPPLTMRRHLDHTVAPIQELRTDLPGPLADFVMRLIARNPDDRPGSAERALHEFQGALAGNSPLTGPIAVAQPNAREVTGPTGPTTPTGRILVTGTDATAAHRNKAATGRTSTVARKPAARSGKVASSANATPSLKVPIAMLIGSLILAAIIIPLALRNGKPPDSYNPPKSASSTGSAKSTPGTGTASASTARPKNRSSGTPPLPPASKASLASGPQHVNKLPTQLPRPAGTDAKAAALAPPVTDGLVGHYHASALTFREDLKTPAKTGDTVSAWGNLASEADYHYLTRLDDRKEQAPTLIAAESTGYPAFNSTHPMVYMEPDQGLRTRSKPNSDVGIDDSQLTFFAVIKAVRPNGHILRFDGKNKHWNYLVGQTHKEGYRLSISQTGSKQRKILDLGAPLQQLLIFGGTWNGSEGKQILRITLTSGKHEVSPPMTIEQQPIDMLGYVIGNPNIPGSVKENSARFGGGFAEILIYNRALDDQSARLVEDHLYQRYFQK